MAFAPLVTSPADPLELDPRETFAVPRTVGRMVGEGRARDAVRSGVFRPADIDDAELSEVESIWLPLWFVEGSVDSFSIGFVATERTRWEGPDAGVLGGPGRQPPRSPKKRRVRSRSVHPRGGFSHHDGVVPVLARRGFPIDPSRKIKIRKPDLATAADLVEPEATVLPDLPRQDAEELARWQLSRRGQPRGTGTMFADVNVHITNAQLCYYPLYVLRYRYGGQAVDGSSIFFVAVSGTTGKVVASEHPSAWSSVGGKLRRLFGGS